jgi:plastocyanin domain-containing protein
MLNRGVTALNLNILKSSNNYNDYLKSTLVDNYQVINFNLEYDNYKDIIIQKDIPVKIIINVDKKYLTGCNNKILIDEFNIEKELTIGENIIEFTPNKEETITYTCWMRMIKNKIKVIDDLDYFKGE